ncbi:MAG: ABC transporter ATP-binding protein [Planctomycetota bacterium]
MGVKREDWPRLRRLISRLLQYLLQRKLLLFVLIASQIAAASIQVAPVMLADDIVTVMFPDYDQSQAGKGSVLGGLATTLQQGIDDGEGEPGWIAEQLGSLGDDDRAQFFRIAAITILLLVVGLAAGLTSFLSEYISRFLSARVVVDIRRELCGHLLGLSLHFHNSRKTGDTLSRLTNDIFTAYSCLRLVLGTVFLSPFKVVFLLIAAFFVNPVLAGALFVFAPLVAWPLAELGRRVRKSSRKTLMSLADATQSMMQMFSGIRTVKAFQMEERELEEFDRVNERFLKVTMKMVRAKSMGKAFVNFSAMAGFAIVVLAAGVASVFWTDVVQPGQVVSMLICVSLIYPEMRRLTEANNTVQESLAGAERLFEVLDTNPQIVDAPGAVALSGIRDGLRFENVSFRYEDEMILSHVDFEASVGQLVAIVGPSGGGKSTLLDLIPRFYDPTEGRILIDGIDLRQIRLASLIEHVALVGQEPFLFNISISENIRYGRPSATDSEVEAAARAANIHEFIETLPEGYATEVGERGVKLSGGQLQRITIARAILKNASILLLDEATSALDSESERAVQAALDNLMEGKTCFVIAHRLSTIRHADQIIVIEKGKIIDTGSHQELYGRDGMYRRLYDLQFSEVG